MRLKLGELTQHKGTMPKFEQNGDGKPKFEPGRDLQAIAAKHERAIQKALEAQPPKVTEPRCHVCNSPHRSWVEAQIIRAHSYRSIEQAMIGLPEEERIERRSIARHVQRGHMNIDDTAIRAIIEEEATIDGKNFEEGVRGALSLHAVLEVMVRKGYEDVLAGNTLVEARDLIQLTKLKMDMDERHSIAMIDEAKRQVNILIQAMRDKVPQEYLDAVIARVGELKEQQQEPSDIVGLIRPQIESTADEL
jgi:hypothetical protein